MDVKNIQIEYATERSFTSSVMDGVCHIKTLPYLSVVQSVKGSYSLRIKDGKTLSTREGGFFFAPSDVLQTITHHNSASDNYVNCRWVFLSVKLNGRYELDKLYDFPTILPDAVSAEMNTVFNKLFSAASVFEKYVCYFQIIQLLMSVSTKRTGEGCAIDQALIIIKEDYSSPITVSELAQACNTSESNFYSLFKKHTGCSPIAYLNSYRLSVAAELLVSTTLTVSDVARSVGIPDSIYFNKLFRKAYRLSPTKYRTLNR